MYRAILFTYVVCILAQAIEHPSMDANLAELTPLFLNPLISNSGRDGVDRRDNPLAGLLVRQSCPLGWGLCNDGVCCPLGGRCCGGGECCDPGQFCYAGGCCRNSETGCEGNTCCPANYSCCSGGGCCRPGTYCVEGGCCEIGRICTSGGSAGGVGGGGGGDTPTTTRAPIPDPTTRTAVTSLRTSSPATTRTTTLSTTSDIAPNTTPTITRTTASTTATISTSPVRSITATAVVPSPTPSSGSSMVEIPATDPQITYRGSWRSVTSSCNASSQSRMATGPSSSFSFNFQGDAVYLSLSSYNALYNVTVRGRTTTFGASDSRVIPSNCSLSFGQAALPGQSNAIEVIVSGSSLDSAGQWSFAMEKIVVASTSPAPAPSNKSAPAIIKWVTATIGAAFVLILLMV